MGKCVFTGKETDSKFLFLNKNLYVCDDVISIIQKAISDTNPDIRVASFNQLLDLIENVDEKYIDTIQKFLGVVQTLNIGINSQPEELDIDETSEKYGEEVIGDESNDNSSYVEEHISKHDEEYKDASTKYNKSKGAFTPPLGMYFLRKLGIGLGIAITFGLLAPWFIILEEKWECQYLKIDGYPVHFDAPVGQYYLKCIVWALLTIITFGIYGIFVPVYSRRWMNEYLFIDKEDENITE